MRKQGNAGDPAMGGVGDPASLACARRTRLGQALFVLGVAISLLHLWFNLWATLPNLTQNSLHYAGFALLCALVYPLGAGEGRAVFERKGGFLLAADIAIGLVTAFSAVYMVAREDAIYARGVHLDASEWFFGIVLILSAIEFTRRTTGWVIPILIVVSLSYVAWWGDMVSGVFRFGGLSLETLLFRSIYGDDGLFGNIARISSTFVFMFILFGAFLLRSGAGDFVIEIARAAAGRTVGGPGFVAVIASGLTGTISGSAVANTASTGVVTIPLMQKSGFPPKFAAAVEAAASTGGQLMPPIMGAGAFVMASYTQISYTTIVAVSFLPALLYFLSVMFFVRIESRKRGVQPLGDAGPRLGEVMRRGGIAFLLPIALLIGLLVYGFTPTYAAGFAILAVVGASWLTPRPMGPARILEALSLGARNMVMTAILLCAVGLIVNVIATAGIGNTFSLMITEWAGSSLLLALVLVALASLVLGMGLPVTAAYIVLATLSAPALYNLIVNGYMVQALAGGALGEEARAVLLLALPDQAELLAGPMGLEQAAALLAQLPVELKSLLQEQLLNPALLGTALLSAHMIIFWLSQDSNVTPPVCLTAFTAAAIARTPPMATGLAAWKVAKGLYVVPLLFAYTPFLGGDPGEALRIFFFSLFGLYALSAAIEGWIESPLALFPRLLALVAAVALLWPGAWWRQAAGGLLFLGLFAWSRKKAGRPEGQPARN